MTDAARLAAAVERALEISHGLPLAEAARNIACGLLAALPAMGWRKIERGAACQQCGGTGVEPEYIARRLLREDGPKP